MRHNAKIHCIDTHTHLCDPVFDDDRAAVIDNAWACGVEAIILVAETIHDARLNLELSRQDRRLHAAAGLYPANVSTERADEIHTFIREHHANLVAIGEVGLDFRITDDAYERSLQGDVFLSFITLANELNLPLNVHSRSSGRQVIDLLLKHNVRQVQLHAFDGKFSTAQPAIEAGYYFSIPPSIVRSRQKQKLLSHLPLSSLLLETDSPVLGPDSDSSTRNVPANIIVALDAIATAKHIDRLDAAQIILENTLKLYPTLHCSLK